MASGLESSTNSLGLTLNGGGGSNKLGQDNNPRIPVNANLLSYGKASGPGGLAQSVSSLKSRGNPYYIAVKGHSTAAIPYAAPSNSLLSNKYYSRLTLYNLTVGKNMANKSKQVKIKN